MNRAMDQAVRTREAARKKLKETKREALRSAPGEEGYPLSTTLVRGSLSCDGVFRD